MQKVRFSFLCSDKNDGERGRRWNTLGKWISQRFNNGKSNFWFVCELNDLSFLAEKPYLCTLCMITPDGYEEFDEALEYYGWDSADPLTDADVVEIIHLYAADPVWEKDGFNYSKLFQECRKEAQRIIDQL
jgi:hypothetical protein